MDARGVLPSRSTSVGVTDVGSPALHHSCDVSGASRGAMSKSGSSDKLGVEEMQDLCCSYPVPTLDVNLVRVRPSGPSEKGHLIILVESLPCTLHDSMFIPSLGTLWGCLTHRFGYGSNTV